MSNPVVYGGMSYTADLINDEEMTTGWSNDRPTVPAQPPMTDGLDPGAPGGPNPLNGTEPLGQPVVTDPLAPVPQKDMGGSMPYIKGPDVDQTVLKNYRTFGTRKNMSQDIFWNDVATDHDSVKRTSALVHGKVAVSSYWPFLSGASNTEQFEDRLQIVASKIESLVEGDVLPDVLASLRDDFSRIAGVVNRFDADKYENETGQRIDNPYSTGEKKECPACNGWGTYGDGDGKQTCEDCGGKGHLTKEDPARKRWYGTEASKTAYIDPSDAERYNHYPPITPQPLGVGEGSTDFPVDLAQGEQRTPEAYANQLTPGEWVVTPGSAMPERPMPFSQQRGYVPVGGDQSSLVPNYLPNTRSASLDAEGFVIEAHSENPGASSPAFNQGYGHGIAHATHGVTWGGGDFRETKEKHTNQEDRGAFSYGYYKGHDHGLQLKDYGNVDPWKNHADRKHEEDFRSPFDKEGFFIQAKPDAEKKADENADKLEKKLFPQKDKEDKYAKAGEEHDKKTVEKAGSYFDKEGFLVQATPADGSYLDPLLGTPTNANPYYFDQGQAGLASDQSAGFPVDPSVEPLEDRANTYGAVPPQVSSGSQEGLIDGGGYSRNLNSTSKQSPNFNVTAVNGETDGKFVKQCPGCKKPLRHHEMPGGRVELHHAETDAVRCNAAKKTSLMSNVSGNSEGRETPYTFSEGAKYQKANFGLNQFFDPKDANIHMVANDEGTDSEPQPVTDADNTPQADPQDLSMVAVMQYMSAEDFVGRPDATNPTGLGPDEYQANHFRSFEDTHPFQLGTDRNVNTPTLPQTPIKTLDTDHNSHMEQSSDEEDEDE